MCPAVLDLPVKHRTCLHVSVPFSPVTLGPVRQRDNRLTEVSPSSKEILLNKDNKLYVIQNNDTIRD